MLVVDANTTKNWMCNLQEVQSPDEAVKVGGREIVFQSFPSVVSASFGELESWDRSNDEGVNEAHAADRDEYRVEEIIIFLDDNATADFVTRAGYSSRDCL